MEAPAACGRRRKGRGRAVGHRDVEAELLRRPPSWSPPPPSSARLATLDPLVRFFFFFFFLLLAPLRRLHLAVLVRVLLHISTGEEGGG